MKENLLLIFGGKSSEHDISCMSATTVKSAVDTEKYRIITVGITKSGAWVYVPEGAELTNPSWEKGEISAVLSPDSEKKCLYLLSGDTIRETVPVSVILPVLHGLNGEDGTVQGLFELSGIPFVGSGVLGSAVSMDKVTTKALVSELGIRQARFVALRRAELSDMQSSVLKIEEALPYPVFVKPSSAGSSMGVSKAEDRESLEKALILASQHDARILVEEAITGREIECAVLSKGDELLSSGVGEILSAAEFYDFDAKYHNADSRTEVHPVLPEGVEEEVRRDAERIFRAVSAHSLSRVDFFLDKDGVVFNEINTLPGFTAISMYPMLMKEAGLPLRDLVAALIESAFSREDH